MKRAARTPGPLLSGGLLLAMAGCSAIRGDLREPLDAGVKQQAQARSLRFAHYRGAPEPAPPGDQALAALELRLREAPASERRELEEYYGREARLLALAMRDSDSDGVRDYRISNYYGKYLEGDVDADGDGVRNVYDAAPFNPLLGGRDGDGDGIPDQDFADANGNGIPDHVDWRYQGRSDDASARQEELFRAHKILLVERSAELGDQLARTVYDVVTRVLRGPFSRAPVLPALRTIATDETCLLSAEVDDGTSAMTISQTQTLTLFQAGIDFPPLVQLGLLTHELGHAWQLSLDFDEHDLARENARIAFPAPEFHALVAELGWKVEPLELDPSGAAPAAGYQSFTPHYLELQPAYRWKGRSTRRWARRLERVYRRRGADYLVDRRLAGLHIVSDYSLSSPWEWHSENLMAYLYLELEGQVEETLAGRGRELESALAAMAAALRQAWPAFRHHNLDRGRLLDHFRSFFPLREDDLSYLVETYVLPFVGGSPNE